MTKPITEHEIHHEGDKSWGTISAEEVSYMDKMRPRYDRTYLLSGWISGPKTANIHGFLKSVAFINDVQVEMEIFPGFWREYVSYRFTAKNEDVLKQTSEQIDKQIKKWDGIQ